MAYKLEHSPFFDRLLTVDVISCIKFFKWARKAARYEPNSMGMNLAWANFRYPSRPILANPHPPTPASCTMVSGSLSPGVKRPRRGFHHPNCSSTEIKVTLELKLYSLSLGLHSLFGAEIHLSPLVNSSVLVARENSRPRSFQLGPYENTR